MKVVIDTNIFVMSFSRRSVYHDVFKSIVDGRYTLVVSHEILLEYEEILAVKYGIEATKFFLDLLEELPNVEYVHRFYHFHLLKDADDDKFIDVAFQSNAKYLVSEDGGFKILKRVKFPKINLIRIHEFMEILKELKP
jgi:uncharacterized protein